MRHGTLQINIYCIKALILVGFFFFNKTSKEERKVLFQSPKSLRRCTPLHSADTGSGKNYQQRNEVKPLFPHQGGHSGWFFWGQ